VAFLLFVDESGHDGKDSPYEVLAGIAVEDKDLWNLISNLNDLEEKLFGLRFSRAIDEIKGKIFLKKKVFRHLEYSVEVEAADRVMLTKECLENGAMNHSPKHLKALAQSKILFVEKALELCARFRCKAFASIVDQNAPRSEFATMLRKDYSVLF
jgi:hypothetical protein